MAPRNNAAMRAARMLAAFDLQVVAAAVGVSKQRTRSELLELSTIRGRCGGVVAKFLTKRKASLRSRDHL